MSQLGLEPRLRNSRIFSWRASVPFFGGGPPPSTLCEAEAPVSFTLPALAITYTPAARPADWLRAAEIFASA